MPYTLEKPNLNSFAYIPRGRNQFKDAFAILGVKNP